MSSVQIWTIIGVMATAFASMIGLVLMVVSSKFDTIVARIDTLSARIDGLSDRIGNLETRVHGIETTLMKPPNNLD